MFVWCDKIVFALCQRYDVKGAFQTIAGIRVIDSTVISSHFGTVPEEARTRVPYGFRQTDIIIALPPSARRPSHSTDHERPGSVVVSPKTNTRWLTGSRTHGMIEALI